MCEPLSAPYPAVGAAMHLCLNPALVARSGRVPRCLEPARRQLAKEHSYGSQAGPRLSPSQAEETTWKRANARIRAGFRRTPRAGRSRPDRLAVSEHRKSWSGWPSMQRWPHRVNLLVGSLTSPSAKVLSTARSRRSTPSSNRWRCWRRRSRCSTCSGANTPQRGR